MRPPPLLKSLLSRKVAFGATLGGAVLFMVFGVVLWGGFNWGMEITNTGEFCISCHEMRDNVYAEYVGTAHDGNRSGVRASCPDCHVPRPWVHKIVRKIRASNEVYHWLLGTVGTPEKFDAHRMTMAQRVWDSMKETDSRECRNCHDWDTMNPENQQARARNQHRFAMEQGHTCIDCHKGIAHKPVHEELSEEELEALAAPDPDYVREIPQSFLDGLARVEAAEAEAEKAAQEQAKREREQRKEAKLAEQARIDAAVAAALAAAKQAGGAVVPAAAAAGAQGAGGQGFGVNWSGVPDKTITIFYPGQTSMEWTLVGKYHGGARPFKAGDRCTVCHDKETADMGQKMVSGEKAETTPIPGKRPAIPLRVQAAHDDANLYLRFEWEDTAHVPVPFVDGGKMDPNNPVKLAVMFATDDIKYAGQAGCWGTCHEDLRTMPGHPEDPASAGLALDVSDGVTKYIAASRTKIEEKGRRGKKLGGWDKLKEAAEIEAELANGQFVDLLRWNADGKVENGYVLEQRVMAEGGGVEAQGWLDGGIWTVVFKRPLGAEEKGDLAIEAGKTYNIGFAIHDDFSNARYHHVSLGYRFALDDDAAEINAVKANVDASAVASAAPAAATTTVAAAAPTAAAAKPAGGGGAGVDDGVDWSKAGEGLFTLFYPGQTSMEWTLVGKYHGGARPFKAGDRCTVCHDKETADMGQKMVSGEKAETTPIPGKRPAIPLRVQATHDNEHLYLRFEWEDTAHVPVPFVDGGKMDPNNPTKLAVMFATDDIKYAGQAGCWGTCHEDLRTMPGHPEDPAAAGLALDVSDGVTKYIAASRAKIEEKGRRGKKLGGWDKLKDAAEIDAELAKGQFVDLLRVNGGDGSTEDGLVLAERVMSGGQGFDASVVNEAGYWTVTIKRRLTSDKPGDVSFESGKVYNVGFAIHDDFSSARFHHVSLGYRFGLDAADVELNATGQ